MERDGRPLGEEVLDLGGLDDATAPGGGNGGQESVGSGRRPSRRALLVGGGLLVVVGAVVNAVGRGSATPPTPVPQATSPAPSLVGSALASPSATGENSPPLPITNLGHPLLGVTAGWDLFALGAAGGEGVLVRIHLASGRITRSALPPVGDGAASLVPARGRLLIQSADYQQGYAVPDNGPGTDLPPPFNHGVALLPGPDADHVWVQDPPNQMRLVTLDGKPAGLDFAFPPFFGPGVPDGNGYVLLGGVGGVYRGDHGGLRRVSTGQLLAVGRTGFVSVDCDDRARCRAVLHTNDGRTSVVPGILQPQSPITGAISPDGAAVVLSTFGPAGELSATLVELASGARRRIKLSLTPNAGGEGAIVWSPDGRWLFAVDASQQLKVINARTLAVTDLVPGLSSIRQLVIRR